MHKLFVVGLGPGGADGMTIRAKNALENSDVIVGYTVYIDLVRDAYPDKEFLTTPMRREVDRVRLALETAAQGRTVAMVCSGDAGVYSPSLQYPWSSRPWTKYGFPFRHSRGFPPACSTESIRRAK